MSDIIFMQLAKAAELDIEDDLFEYFKVHMAPSIVSIQGSIGSFPQYESMKSSAIKFFPS